MKIMQQTSTSSSSASRPSTSAEQFLKIRAQTEALIKPLSAEDCQLQSMPDASPAKWHLAHITWFFETFVLERYELDFKPFEASFRVLFNSYYNGVGDQFPRPQRGLISRPALAEVLDYRRQVNQRILQVMDKAEDRDSANNPAQGELQTLLALGLQHEQQHQELLLTDIKHALSLNPASPAYAKRWPLASIAPQPLRWLPYAGGLVEHGHDAALDGEFAFDNETPRHRAYVPAFELSNRLVSNGEFAAFIADGGYQRPDLWLALGWDWRQAGQHSLPLYWQSASDSGRYSNFTLQGLVELDTNTPACHLNFFEADAFARWSGARLPTEFEWELAARRIGQSRHQHPNFVDNAAYHPLPLQQAWEDEPAQMFGDVWEWTQSSYNPYPGYKPWGGLVGEYNGKFMCNQLVLRGGSCATPQSHIRASYRNFFPPDARWQFSGLRLARDAF